MRWTEVKVVFQSENPGVAAEAIAAVFDDLGVNGVVVEDPDAEPEEGWADDEVVRPEAHAVIGFFPDDPRLPTRCRRLERRLARMADEDRVRTRVGYRVVDEQDWAESWKAFFWPERISRRLVVKPTWREYTPEPGQIVLEIDPGMAFGTGTHPTTRLCIHLLETHLASGDRVLDVGTGSGILLVASAKLGAGLLHGVDIDPVAAAIARENLMLNGVPRGAFTLAAGGADTVRGRPFDCVVANILSEVIVGILGDVSRVLKDRGVFICSGIVRKNRDRVAEALAEAGFVVHDERLLDGWVALAARRR